MYEYLLSLDALPEPPPRRDGSNGHSAPDTTLIGAEEVAALGRNGHLKTVAEPHVPQATPVAKTEPVAEVVPEAQTDPSATTAAERVEAGLAELDAQLSPDDLENTPTAHFEPEDATTAAEALSVADHPSEPATRPAFTLFRRTGAAASKADKASPDPNGSAAAEPASATNGSGPAQAEAPVDDPEAFVKPKSGFHLSELADFAVVQRSAAATEAPEEPAALEPFDAIEPEPVQEFTEPEPELEHQTIPVQPAQEAASGAAARGWRLRDDDTDQHDLTSETDSDDNRFETDPEVVEARLEINDRLRRRRCDEAAALLQRLANDVGGRALAELALDAGDRCRALGKGNAALSCYLAASRADPVHETPLLRLADICIDDHDIDLAVSYLERVTRLRRLRNDDKGALKLYRKIVTIAPYRDDILAMLMRAQANGRFDE